MSQLGEDDPFDYELMEDGQSFVNYDPGPMVEDVMYHRWDVISERVYPSVSINEYSVRGDENAERYYAEYPGHFSHDIGVLSNKHRAHAINFKVIAVDHESGTQFDVMLRVDTEDGLLDLERHIEENTAPVYNGEYGSDNVTGLHIIWKLGWVQFITQDETSTNVTMVVGESTMFPGYVTKVINSMDHGINYSAFDCVFECLNEATGARHNPTTIRAELFDGKDLLSPVDIKLDMVKIAKYYRCNISVHSIDDDKKSIASKDKSLQLVRLVRMGLAIGVIDVRCELQSESIVDVHLGALHAYYDLETVSDSSSTQVYGFSLLWCDGTRVTLLHHDTSALYSSIREALKGLMDTLPKDNKIVYLHAWNGSRFDHPLLLNICSERFKVGYVTMNQQREILSANIHCSNRSLILRDPCKMLPMSLKDACALFKIAEEKLSLDHSAIEEAYLCGKLERYIAEHHETIKDYVIRDVETLREVTQGIMGVYNETGLDYCKYLTRSMASHSMWDSSLSSKTKLDLSSVQFTYNDVVSFNGTNHMTMEQIKTEAIGGRVQCIRGEYEHVTLLDFRSMYPSVATSELYPCGDYVATERYIPGALGLYRVEIIGQHHPHVVPYRRSKCDAYDWSYNGKFTKLITNVEVDCLIESESQFRILDGVVWEGTANYFSEHMNKLYELRQQSKTKNNTVLVEHYKHMANSLTGAIFQQLRREYVRVFATKQEADIYMKMYSRYIQLSYELTYDNGQIVLFFIPKRLIDPIELKTQSVICRGAIGSRPIILTMFIYAYARAKLWRMWRYVEDNSIGTIVYCDTDSLAIVSRYTEGKGYVNPAVRLKTYIGNSMGQLDIVISNASMVAISPKVYAMRSKDGRERVRMRSVNRKDVLYLLSPNTEWIATTVKKLGWLHVRQLYTDPIEDIRVQLCYDTVKMILAGNTVLATHWYYVRTKGHVEKRYNVMVLRDKNS